MNCGQTCIAPDYILCESSIQDKVINEIQKCIQVCFYVDAIALLTVGPFVFIVLFIFLQEFYTNDPKSFEDYGRIINQRHFKRIMALTEGSTVAIGGDSDESECYIGMHSFSKS